MLALGAFLERIKEDGPSISESTGRAGLPVVEIADFRSASVESYSVIIPYFLQPHVDGRTCCKRQGDSQATQIRVKIFNTR